MDGKLVVFDRGDRAVAEFLVKYTFADGKAADPAQFFAAPRHRARIGHPRIVSTGRRGGAAGRHGAAGGTSIVLVHPASRDAAGCRPSSATISTCSLGSSSTKRERI